MNLKSFLLVTLSAVLITFHSVAVNFKGGKDPLEITYIKNTKSKPDATYQAQLRKSPSWQAYIKTHKKWFVEFNESSQMPHRAFGKPVAVHGTDPVSAAMDFITNHLSDWNLPMQDLKFQSQNASGKYFNVFYNQTYHGLEVLNSRVFIKMTKDYRVNTWGLDVFSINIPVIPSLSETMAIDRAKTGMNGRITDVSKTTLKILPVPVGRTIVCHLVYELIVSTINESKVPSKYYTLVDANSGEILFRHNKVYFFQPLNSTVNVRATVFEYHPLIAPVSLPLPNMKVDVGGTIYYTDSLGNLSLTGTNPINADFSLEGLYSQVFTDMGNVVPSLSVSLPSGADTVNMDSVASIRHTSGYYHVNSIHHFMKGFFPAFTDLDFPLPTRIDVTGGFCNAFFSGVDINFFETGSGCNCMSQVADVVYHEYGHGINDYFYNSLGGNFLNSGMHEGYADVWALSLTQNPILGNGVDSSGFSFIRRYDINRKVYPQDITPDPHDVGEIIAGAWYDVSLNMGSWNNMTTLYTQTFYDLISGPDGNEGQIFSDVLLSALTNDDDDGDLSNGTPNAQAIIDAFALHGIFLINDAAIEHTPVLSAAAQAATTINTTLTTQFPWLVSNPELFYRTDNISSYTLMPMTPGTGNTFSVAIPPQPSGTIISYFIKLKDIASTTLQTLPAEADSADANIPYFILVDCGRDQIEDFDSSQTPGWVTGIAGDNATGGLWIIAHPLISYKIGDTCQTGSQHTPNGVNCAVTGNATSPASPNYSADVDAGVTTLQSPALSVSGLTEPIVSYWRWYTNDQGPAPRADFWQTWVSGDGINFIRVENIDVPDHSWRRFVFKVSDYVPSATNITLRFVAEDADTASVIEAAVDDIEIYGMNPVGISSPVNAFNFSLFPNPASSILTLILNNVKPGKMNLEILNNLGQKVQSSESEIFAGRITKNVDIQSLSNGIYFLLLRNGEQHMQQMFSVNR